METNNTKKVDEIIDKLTDTRICLNCKKRKSNSKDFTLRLFICDSCEIYERLCGNNDTAILERLSDNIKNQLLIYNSSNNTI